jgi:hypothetical protein
VTLLSFSFAAAAKRLTFLVGNLVFFKQSGFTNAFEITTIISKAELDLCLRN